MIEIYIGILAAAVALCMAMLLRIFVSVAAILKQLRFDHGDTLKDRTVAIEARQAMQGLAIRFQIEDAKVGILVCDSVGEAESANGALAFMFGMDAEDMIGRGWLKPIGPTQKDREALWELWVNSVKTGIPFVETFQIRNIKSQLPTKVQMTAHPHRQGPKTPILTYYCTFTYV